MTKFAEKFGAGLLAVSMAAPSAMTNVLAEDVTELEPGVHVDGNKVTFVYKDADEKDAVSVTVSGNMQWYKYDETKDYDASGDNSAMPAYDAYHYEEGMFNTGYGINSDSAVYALEEKGDEYFELTLELPGTLYYYDYTVTYADGSKKTIKDPANMPEPNEATGSDAGHSLFYVGDAENTIKGQEYVYPRDDQNGTYEFVPYTAADGTTQYLGVYLPYGYDESKTYKVVYVSHGGGGNENEWMTIGAVPNILDNLIADGEIEPTIAVTMDNTYFKWNYDNITKNFEEAIFPFMEENYPVSKDAADRALCGLSMGSMTTTTLMQRRPDLFGYYGGFSGANVLNIEVDTEELAKKVILLTAGCVDMAYYQSKPATNKTMNMADKLDELGIDYDLNILGGAHDWGVWRESFTIFAKDYLWEGKPFEFEDVQDPEKYYYDPVYWAVENGITTGTTPTTFSPEQKVTRGQFVTFLYRAAGEPDVDTSKLPFTDVKAGAYYEKAVAWALENDITTGTSETTFAPNEKCTRAQIVTFLWRFCGKPEAKEAAGFSDVKAGSFYEEAVNWAAETGVTTGTSATKFSPESNCTRGQAVTFLYRAVAE